MHSLQFSLPVFESRFQLERSFSARFAEYVRWHRRRPQTMCEDQRHIRETIQRTCLRTARDRVDNFGTLSKGGDVSKPFEAEPHMHAAVNAKVKEWLFIGRVAKVVPARETCRGINSGSEVRRK